MPDPVAPRRPSRCAAYLCPDLAQGWPDCGEEFGVGHLRVVHEFRRWPDCRDAFLIASDLRARVMRHPAQLQITTEKPMGCGLPT